MKLFDWKDLDVMTKSDKKFNITMGVFDGIHRGHQEVIKQILDPFYPSLVITFRQNPKKVLRPYEFSGDLMPLENKIKLWESLKVSAVLLIDFSKEFGMMTGRSFFEQLTKAFALNQFIVGWDFSFGKGKAHSARDIKSWTDAPVIEVKPFFWNGQVVSSSLIRDQIKKGDMASAVDFLGHPYILKIPEIRQGLNLNCFNQVLPPIGRYPCYIDGNRSLFIVEKNAIFWESPSEMAKKEIIFKE
jgi:riboflavin kinase / FMN adenylyltransferase